MITLLSWHYRSCCCSVRIACRLLVSIFTERPPAHVRTASMTLSVRNLLPYPQLIDFQLTDMEPLERSTINSNTFDRQTSDCQCADGESGNTHYRKRCRYSRKGQ